MAGCCGTTIGDTTNNTQINVSIQSYLFELNQLYIAAGLDIDVAFPSTPDNFDSDPEDTAPEALQRNRALCIAVDSFVDETFNRALAWLESQTEEVAGLIVAGVAVPYVPVYAVIGAFIGLGTLAGFVIIELLRSEYRDYLACAMFEELKGKDTNDPSNFFNSADNLPARPPPSQDVFQDAARDAIEAWFRSQINNIDNYLGFIKTLNVAMGMAASLDDEDCSCISGWEHTFMAGFGLQSLVASDVGCDGLTAIYNPTEDRLEGVPCVAPSNFALRAHGHLLFDVRTITRVRLYVDYVSTRTTGSDYLRINHDGILIIEVGVSGSADVILDTGAISISTGDLKMLALVASSDGSPPDTSGAKAWMWKVVVNGTGENPF